MLFCIDIGNTNIVLGVTRDNKILHHWRIRTEKEITADELGILVGNFFQWEGLGFKDIKNTIVSCVVPPSAEYGGGFFTPVFRRGTGHCGAGP